MTNKKIYTYNKMALNNNSQLRFLWDQQATSVTVDGSNIKESDIVFLPQKNQIFVNGVYFGLTDALKTEIENAITNLSDAQGNISELEGRVGTLETNVGSTAALAKSLAAAANDLQASINGDEIYHIGSGTVPTATTWSAGWTDTPDNIYDALNTLRTLVDAATSAAGVTSVGNASGDTSIEISGTGSGPYTGAITIKTDASKIKTVSAISKTDGKGVDIAAGTSVESALGTINTALKGVQGDIAAASDAAGAAQSSANDKIAKSPSDTTDEALSGVQGAKLTTAAAIADAIEAAYGKLLGTQTDFAANEQKTLGQLRTLIAGLRSDVGSLQNAVTGMDPDSAAKITDIINELKQVGDSDQGDFANTILDRLTPFLAYANTYDSLGTQGAQGGYYKVSKLDGTQSYVNNVQGLIDALSAEIVAAKNAGVGAGVTSLNSKTGAVTITGSQGVTVDNNTGNEIKLKATSEATTTAALTQSQSGYGATTASGSTIQTALQDINNAASSAGKTAADAGAAASAAQSTADTAIAQLKWVVV